MDDKWIEKLDILGFNGNFEWEIVDKCWWVFSVGGGYGPSILRVGEILLNMWWYQKGLDNKWTYDLSDHFMVTGLGHYHYIDLYDI